MIGHRFFALAALTLPAAACGDDPSRLKGGPQPTADAAGDPVSQAAALTAADKPEGRSYVLFDGAKLEATRTNENVGVNRVRIKPYAALAGEYQRVLGAAPPSLASAAGSFDDPPKRWYAEAKHSGVSLDASFAIAFEGCQSYVA
jgi:hypothetical protein